MVCTRNSPIAFASVSVAVSLPFGHTQFLQICHPCFRLLPLLPDIYPDSVPQPFVPFLHSCLEGRYPVVVQPSRHVDLYFLHDLPDIDSTVSLRNGAQLVLCFQQGFGMDTNEQPILSLAVCKAQKLQVMK